MLNVWLENALTVSGLSHAELARRLTGALGRSVEKTAVTRMVSGQRKISGDELIESSRICGLPIPFSLRTEEMDSSSIPFSGELYDLDDSVIIQFSVGDLRKAIRDGIIRKFSQIEKHLAECIAQNATLQMLRKREFKMILDSRDGETLLLERLNKLIAARLAEEHAVLEMQKTLKRSA